MDPPNTFQNYTMKTQNENQILVFRSAAPFVIWKKTFIVKWIWWQSHTVTLTENYSTRHNNNFSVNNRKSDKGELIQLKSVTSNKPTAQKSFLDRMLAVIVIVDVVFHFYLFRCFPRWNPKTFATRRRKTENVNDATDFISWLWACIVFLFLFIFHV